MDIRESDATVRRSGSRAKAQKRSQEHISRIPASGRLASQSSIRLCGSRRWGLSLYRLTKFPSQRLASASVSGLWKWYSVSCASFTVRNGRSTFPFERAVTRLPSDSAGMCVFHSTPSRSITVWNTRLFATGPLSR